MRRDEADVVGQSKGNILRSSSLQSRGEAQPSRQGGHVGNLGRLRSRRARKLAQGRGVDLLHGPEELERVELDQDGRRGLHVAVLVRDDKIVGSHIGLVSVTENV